MHIFFIFYFIGKMEEFVKKKEGKNFVKPRDVELKKEKENKLVLVLVS